MPLTGEWYPSPYCRDCIDTYFISAQWNNFLDLIKKADCAAALKRLLAQDPPKRVRDAGFVKCKETTGNNNEVIAFWDYKAKKEFSSALTNVPSDEEYDSFVKEQRMILAGLEEVEAANPKPETEQK